MSKLTGKDGFEIEIEPRDQVLLGVEVDEDDQPGALHVMMDCFMDARFAQIHPDQLADFCRQGLALARKAGATETPREAAERRVVDAAEAFPIDMVEGIRAAIELVRGCVDDAGDDIGAVALQEFLAVRDALKAEREQA